MSRGTEFNAPERSGLAGLAPVGDSYPQVSEPVSPDVPLLACMDTHTCLDAYVKHPCYSYESCGRERCSADTCDVHRCGRHDCSPRFSTRAPSPGKEDGADEAPEEKEAPKQESRANAAAELYRQIAARLSQQRAAEKEASA